MSTKPGRILINATTTSSRENSERPDRNHGMPSSRTAGRRVTISDLQYFVAKADQKLKMLRATLGDYDSQDIEHHKVLKTIFSLVKKLLRLTGDDAAKEFIQTYSNKIEHAAHSAKIKMYDSSGSSGSESQLPAGSDYFPNIQGGIGQNSVTSPLGANTSIMPQVRQSPFSSTKQPPRDLQHSMNGNDQSMTSNGHNKIVIKGSHNSQTPGYLQSHDVGANHIRLSGNQSDLVTMRDSNQQNPLHVSGLETLLGTTPGPAMMSKTTRRNKSHFSKTAIDQIHLQQQMTLTPGAQRQSHISGKSEYQSALSPQIKTHSTQIEELYKMVAKLQQRVDESENRAHSFESFLNHSNPMGLSYVLKPEKAQVHFPVNFDGLKRGQQAPTWLRTLHESLDHFNYSPVPFMDFHRRSFRQLTKTATGDYYEGQWSDLTNKRDGFGYCISLESGYLYEGYWSEGNQHGLGRMILENGYYEGQFNMNQRHGQGKYVWNSGDHYQGEWVSSMKSGFGRLYSKGENQIYEGHFKNNKKHGEGKIISSEGIVIQRGQWRNDQRI